MYTNNIIFIIILLSTAINYSKSNNFDRNNYNNNNDIKIYAIYFPQFYNDELNNKLWGDNFTDWNNLLSAPKYNKNNQLLSLPTELGYYNLLDYNIRKKQSELAKHYTIDGFIYHHYWFYHRNNNKASISKVIESILIDNQPNISFSLNWVKESFILTWNSKYNQNFTYNSSNNNNILYEQYVPNRNDDDLIIEHYNYLRQYFKHPNYIFINNVPLFTIYGNDLTSSDVMYIIQKLKQLAIADGFPYPGLHIPLLRRMVLHPLYKKDQYIRNIKINSNNSYYDSVLYYPYADALSKQMRIPLSCMTGKFHYKAKNKKMNEMNANIGVLTTFDNTPRRNVEEARVFDREFTKGISSIQSFEIDMVTSIMYSQCCNSNRNTSTNRNSKFIVINAWNEWGEGMMLEPSTRYGRNLLLAIKQARNIVNSFINNNNSNNNSSRSSKLVQCNWEAYLKYLKYAGIK